MLLSLSLISHFIFFQLITQAYRMDDKEIHADEHNFKQIAQINRAASF